jgi:hypothetical protein
MSDHGGWGYEDDEVVDDDELADGDDEDDDDRSWSHSLLDAD